MTLYFSGSPLIPLLAPSFAIGAILVSPACHWAFLFAFPTSLEYLLCKSSPSIPSSFHEVCGSHTTFLQRNSCDIVVVFIVSCQYQEYVYEHLCVFILGCMYIDYVHAYLWVLYVYISHVCLYYVLIAGKHVCICVHVCVHACVFAHACSFPSSRALLCVLALGESSLASGPGELSWAQNRNVISHHLLIV